jgi:hypothetical protein
MTSSRPEACRSREALSVVTTTVVDKLVLAAAALDAAGSAVFTAEDLVVKAWQLFPNTFGLSGYVDPDGRASYPDSNRVFAEIMGSKPIRARGLLVKSGSKQYSLTPTGREYAGRLHSAASPERQAGLSRDVRQHLEWLLRSRAYEKFSSGQLDRISFSDAAQFIGVTPRSSAIEFQGRLSAVQATLRAATDRAAGRALMLDNSESAISPDALRDALEVLEFLLQRYREDWDVIRERKSERVSR